jgi:hypothetical protein
MSCSSLTYTEQQMILIAERESGFPLVIHDQERWSKIEEVAR